MKSFTKFLGITIVGLAFSANILAQTATATASATIVTPISIAKNALGDLNFGSIAVTAVAGTVALPASATPTRIAAGGCSLPAVIGTVAAATFTVTGQPNATYA